MRDDFVAGDAEHGADIRAVPLLESVSKQSFAAVASVATYAETLVCAAGVLAAFRTTPGVKCWAWHFGMAPAASR